MAAASVVTIASEASRVNPPEEGGLPDLRIVALVTRGGVERLRCDLGLTWRSKEGEEWIGARRTARQRNGGHQRGKPN